MAKKARKRKNIKKQPTNQRPVERGRRSYLYLGLIGLALVAWIVWRLQPTQGLEVALFWGVVIGLAWGVFIVFYYLSQHKGGKEDE